ncbi:hypothetical protein [Litorivivens sp.]|uniref:hypothetical protein n=3 Tax=Gammaproteobacteria TaxID=1236 RepID=UPI003568FEEE
MALLGNGYQPSPFQGILGQPAGQYNVPAPTKAGLGSFDVNKLLTNPLFHAGMALLGSRSGTGARDAMQGLMQGAQYKTQLEAQQREQAERERRQAALSQLGETMPQLQPFIGTGLESQAMTMLGKQASGGGIGTYNPRDYTTESWTKFIQGGAKDPSVLNRYAGTLEERMASDPEFASKVMKFQGESAGAKEAGKDIEGQRTERIQMGGIAVRSLGPATAALSLLDEVETGGAAAASLKAKQLFGIESADEGELTYLLSKNVLSQLKETFGAAFTAEEGKRLADIEAGIGRNTETNKRLLQRVIDTAIPKVERAIQDAEIRGDIGTAQYLRSELAKYKTVPQGAAPSGGTVRWDELP